MGFKSAKQLGACLARDYSEAFFRLLVNYRDIAASEAASRLGIHIRTAQDFLDHYRRSREIDGKYQANRIALDCATILRN